MPKHGGYVWEEGGRTQPVVGTVTAPRCRSPRSFTVKGLLLLKEIKRDGGSRESEVWAGFCLDKANPRRQAAAEHTSSRQPPRTTLSFGRSVGQNTSVTALHYRSTRIKSRPPPHTPSPEQAPFHQQIKELPLPKIPTICFPYFSIMEK